MTWASTTREDVEALAKRFAARWHDIAPDEESEVAATLRALLDERDAARAKADDYARIAYDAERKAAKANIDATALAGLDAMEIQPVLMAVQEWAISTGKARDLLRCWIVGTFTPDMLPQQMRDLGLSDDDDPAECFLAMRSERDAARAKGDRMREALAKAAAPLEAMTIAGTVRVHSEDVREAIVDGLVAARAALAGAPRHE